MSTKKLPPSVVARQRHELRREIYARSGGRCYNCDKKVGDGPDDWAYEIHHLDGNHGNNRRSNLVIACIRCHNDAHPGRWNSAYNWQFRVSQREDWVREQIARRAAGQIGAYAD